jgi:thiamine-monophosphate kinase
MIAKEIGERGIIEIIRERLELPEEMVTPFGEDVSALDIGEGRLLALKADMLVGSTDIPPLMNYFQAARKAIVMNVSDFASKGMTPKAFMVSLGLPPELGRDEIEQLSLGLNSGAREYRTHLVGGDTGMARDLVIAVSGYGIGERSTLILRSGARPGDFLATTGEFGDTAAGLRALLEGVELPRQLKTRLQRKVLMPQARLDEGLAIAKMRAATASIDSSDGLAFSVHELSRMSRVGFTITKPPVSRNARRFAEITKCDPLDLALYGGEEYELVMTIRPDMWKKAKRLIPSLLKIGVATEEREVVAEYNHRTITVEPRGWEHFKSEAEWSGRRP